MAANASPAQDDLSDLMPGAPATSDVSPYLIMQAQKEVQAGKPGAATHMLGTMALKQGAIHPAVAAGHAEKAGFLPPGTAQTVAQGMPGGAPSMPSDTNPLSQLSQVKNAAQSLGMPTSLEAAKEIPKGTSEQVKSNDSEKTQLQSSQKIPYSPDAIKLNMDTQRGIMHPLKGTDAQGNPIYDMSQSQVDPENPYQEQKSSLQKLQDLLQARRAQPPAEKSPDLTGLMMGADFLNHTNTFVPGYKNVQAQEEQTNQNKEKREQQLYQDQAEAQKGENDLQKDLISSSNATLNGGTQAQLLQKMQDLQLAQGFNNTPKGNATTPMNQVMQQVNKSFKDVQADEAEADKVTSLVNSHNPAAISGIKEALTRLMTGARPQMALIAQQAQDPSLGQRMETWLDLASNGQLPVENVAQMNQMVADLNKVSSGRRAVATKQAMNFGTAMQQDPQVVAGLIPDRASPGLVHQAAAVGHTSQKVAQGKAAANAYNGQGPLPPNPTPAMKQARLEFLKQKAGQ